jgi:hypothetical protein
LMYSLFIEIWVYNYIEKYNYRRGYG